MRLWSACTLILVVAASPAASAQAPLVRVPCVLAEGETAAVIAGRFGLTLQDLEQLNAERDLGAVGPGATILVGYGERVEHRVRRGETLLRIARRFGVTATDVARWNGIRDPRDLRADATLVIYAWPRIPASSSIGRPSDGRLENGVQLRDTEWWEVHDREHAYVTREAAIALDAAFRAIHARWADAARIEIRDASAEDGGPLSGHHSHQSGRDVDLAYMRLACSGACRTRHTDPDELDAERLWRLLEVWLRAGAVDFIFIDRDLQQPLYRAARHSGASSGELARWFQWPSDGERHVGIVRHAPGHRDHLHVRFSCAEHDQLCGPRRDVAEAP